MGLPLESALMGETANVCVCVHEYVRACVRLYMCVCMRLACVSTQYVGNLSSVSDLLLVLGLNLASQLAQCCDGTVRL